MDKDNTKNATSFMMLLNNYIELLQCSAQELACEAGISSSQISRYRKGDTIPKPDSKQIKKIIDGIVSIADKKHVTNITKDDVTEKFNCVIGSAVNFETLKDNLNILIETLDVNVADISRYLGYDPSYISKIRSGHRKPAYIEEFTSAICTYLINNFNDDNSKEKILALINKSEITDSMTYFLELKKWLCSSSQVASTDSNINHFLTELDNFNLDDYIKSMHFDELKIPTLPIKIPKQKAYLGLEEMKKGEIDFFKYTALSKEKGDVFMYNDMPMDDLAKDVTFVKNCMVGIAITLKKGLHLNIIHNIDRPFHEMMLGLESWIPLYMTGQISPYYFKNYSNKVYCHLDYVSANYALSGECINGHHSKGKYFLTSNKNDVKYYNDKSSFLLDKATPLMNIYTKENLKELQKFYISDQKIFSERKRVLSSLPLHTLTEELFIQILETNNVPKDKFDDFLGYLNKDKTYIENITQNNLLTDEICLLDEESFNSHNLSLSIDRFVPQLELKYTYDEYLKHFELSKNYKAKNYKLVINNYNKFKNIDIYINKNNYVVISKKKYPSIHFVIKHEKLANAIENFIPPIV